MWTKRAWCLGGLVAVAVAGGVAAAQTEPQPAHAASAAPATRPASPSAEQMLQQMLRSPQQEARPLRPAQGGGMDATSGANAVAPGAPSVSIQREGTSVVDRVGRLARSGDAQQWEFVFEADGQALSDPPVIILPNLKLMAMEDAVGGSRRDLRFRVTGDLTEYRGRNYLLLRKVLVMPEAEGRF